MKACRPAKCLIQASKPPIPKQAIAGRPNNRCFHQSTTLAARRRRPHYPSLKYDELKNLEDKARQSFPRYTDAQWTGLAHQFSPEQVEVLKLAEEAIDPKDLYTQLKLNNNPWRMGYIDDFSKLDPLLDKMPKVEPTGEQPRHEVYETEDEWAQDFAHKMTSIAFGDANPLTTEETIQSVLDAPQADDRAKLLAVRIRPWIGTEKEQTGRDILEQLKEKLEISRPRPRVGGDYGGTTMDVDEYTRRLGLDPHDEYMALKSGDKEALLRTEHDPAYSVAAAEIPKFDDARVIYPSAEESEPRNAAIRRVSLMTGRSLAELKVLRTKRVVFNRVSNQTRMGKIQSFYTICVAGDGNGLLGIGEGSSTNGADSSRQAQMKAIRNLTPILRYEARTIYGEVKGKVGATQVELSARPPGKPFHFPCAQRANTAMLINVAGFGARCQFLIFEMCKAAGIHDLSARVTRARNPMNTVKAAFQALTKQKLPEDIAKARGRKLIDVRKVYYAGNVL